MTLDNEAGWWPVVTTNSFPLSVSRAVQRVFDPGTGFHDYGACMYWPQIGRFISPDTAAPDLANPASFNWHSYVLNAPHKYTDSTGRTPEGDSDEAQAQRMAQGTYLIARRPVTTPPSPSAPR